MIIVLFPAAVLALDVAGTSRTYLQSRESADKNFLPLYEYLDFSSQNNSEALYSVHFGGWYRYDIEDENASKDVQYGYLSFRGKTANSIVNLGRVMVFEGAAAERLDGLYARTDLQGNFGISAFGGAPVETGSDIPGNNVIYGARISHNLPDVYRIGISYLKEEKNDVEFREEEGLDVWLHPVSKIDIGGRSIYNAITSDWMQHTYNVVLGPFDKLRLIAEASLINYADFFYASTTPVFRLQAGILDPNEKARTLGATAGYDVTNSVNISADYKTHNYQIAGDAAYLGGNIRYAAGRTGSGLSVHRMDGDADRLKYDEYRVYVFTKVGPADIAVDLIDVKYEAAVNGVTNSYSASIAGQYSVTERWNVGADVEYSKNPDFDKDIRTFLKAIYRFDIGSGAGKGA